MNIDEFWQIIDAVHVSSTGTSSSKNDDTGQVRRNRTQRPLCFGHRAWSRNYCNGFGMVFRIVSGPFAELDCSRGTGGSSARNKGDK